jgi:hypothetical protein
MNIFEKIYWRSRNHIEAAITSRRNKDVLGLGCLAQREDKRDLGVFGLFENKPKYTAFSMSVPKWVYNQNPFNDCVFASGAIGGSLQEGMRFSTKFDVKVARHLGQITGNGFSYLRAPRDNHVKIGRLPYHLMPDEVNGQSWEEFSKWDVTPELLAEARKWRIPSYRRITSVGQAIDALEHGYVLFTANKWYSAMNRPQAPHYYLTIAGNYIGGHAWPVAGHRSPNLKTKDYISHQSFGPNYGLNGIARIKSLFDSNMFDIYIEEKLPGRTDEERALGLFDGYAVKGQDEPAIYWIENGQKRAFIDEKAYNKYASYFYILDQNLINNLPTGEPIYA